MSIAAMNWAWLLWLKPNLKLVLMALADAADDEGFCWPSIPTLARKTGMDERSVQRILRILVEYKLLEIKARYRNDGSPTSNKYHLALNKHGDKLSPSQSHNKHQVVTRQTPPSGPGVTQTTTETSINQIQPPLRKAEVETEDSIGKYFDYFYPKQLSVKERELARTQLALLNPNSPHQGQSILDELAAKLNANKITSSPLSYLRALITRANNGQFMPEAGVRVAAARDQAKLAQLKKVAEVIKPSSSSEIPKHLAAMHQVLSRKSTSNLDSKD